MTRRSRMFGELLCVGEFPASRNAGTDYRVETTVAAQFAVAPMSPDKTLYCVSAAEPHAPLARPDGERLDVGGHEREGAMKLIFERLPRLMIGLLMFFAVAVNIANVIARHLFHAPLIWAEEILTFIMIWSIFMGIILVSGRQEHLKMDLVAVSFPKGFTRLISLIIEIVTVIICVVMVIASTQVLVTLGSYDQRSIVAEIPMVIPHLAIPLGFCAIGILHLVNVIKKSRNGM